MKAGIANLAVYVEIAASALASLGKSSRKPDRNAGISESFQSQRLWNMRGLNIYAERLREWLGSLHQYSY